MVDVVMDCAGSRVPIEGDGGTLNSAGDVGGWNEFPDGTCVGGGGWRWRWRSGWVYRGDCGRRKCRGRRLCGLGDCGCVCGPVGDVAGVVHGAGGVVVGCAGDNCGVCEGGDGEVVAADVLPADGSVPPGQEDIADCAGDGVPANLDCTGFDLGGEDGRGELRRCQGGVCRGGRGRRWRG
ncbi:MAG: hypothetical protein F4X56_02235 [Gammaproteobacteria bacterium]|nr:hypothetical protein [Gammaproteobacteria bacterium]